MIIKFRASGTNQGWYGMANALIAAATATAGSTPAMPAGIITWEVLDNTTAGGWNVVNALTPTELQDGTRTGTYAHLVSDTIKTPIDGYQKSFELHRTTAGATNKYGGAYCRAGKWYPGSPNALVANRRLTFYTGSSATAIQSSWADQYYMNNHTYVISVTEQYIWLFQENNTDSLDQLDNKIVGISDYTTGTEWDLHPGSLHFPVGGLYSGSNSTTLDSYDYHRIYAYGIHNQNENYNYEYNDLANWTSFYDNKSGTAMTNPYTLGFGPYPTTSTSTGTSSYFKSNWDINGDDRTALQDVVFWSPLNGMSYRELHGMKFVGWDRANQNYDTKRYRYKWLNANGVKYYLVEAGRCVYALSTV